VSNEAVTTLGVDRSSVAVEEMEEICNQFVSR
jgi:hypothetical protein